MFSDFGWVNRRATFQRLVFDEWLDSISKVVVVELGAGTAIPSIREVGRSIAARKAVTLIRINVREPDVERPQDIGLAYGAVEGLLALDNEIKSRRATRIQTA